MTYNREKPKYKRQSYLHIQINFAGLAFFAFISITFCPSNCEDIFTIFD